MEQANHKWRRNKITGTKTYFKTNKQTKKRELEKTTKPKLDPCFL